MVPLTIDIGHDFVERRSRNIGIPAKVQEAFPWLDRPNCAF